jgi:riboflavin transporter FmnP
MKKFLILTAILEGLTGLALIAIPNRIVLFLLGNPVNGPVGTITAMLAGAAIASLAAICWILREIETPQKLVKGMLFYNFVIMSIASYAIIYHGFTCPGIWLVILSHSFLAAWGGLTLRKT